MPSPRQGSFTAKAPLVTSIGYQALQQAGRLMVIDARAPDRFRGENETLDAAGGHIPGARNHFFRDNLDETGRFKPAAALRAAYDSVMAGRPAADIVLSCGSGVTACHNLLAMEIAGLTGAALYPGSWSEWSAQPGAKVARGEA
jgi:thiosulfate/3-mercaptopyruvate sulfurtransferase